MTSTNKRYARKAHLKSNCAIGKLRERADINIFVRHEKNCIFRGVLNLHLIVRAG